MPNSATETADARSFGPSGVPPECCSETDGKVAGAYPGPGPHGVVCGYVATELDSRCWWRQRSSGVAGAKVALYSAGPDGKLTSSDDHLVATATTDSSGCYELAAVEIPGSYVVKVSEPATAVCDNDNYDRSSNERYHDAQTGRTVVVGRHDKRLVVIPCDVHGDIITPVTVHAITRQQIRFRLRTGRFGHAQD